MDLAFVERCTYDPRFGELAADANVKCSAYGGIFCGQIRKADIFLQRDGRCSTRDVTGLPSMDKYGIVVSRDIFSNHLKTDEPVLYSLLFLPQQRIAANKVRFFQFHYPSQSRFEQCGGSIHVVAVEKVLGFESKRVSRA